MRGVNTPLPTIGDVIHMTIACGRLTNPAIRCVGIAVNTQALDEEAARAELARLEKIYGLPATDPVRFGVMRSWTRSSCVSAEECPQGKRAAPCGAARTGPERCGSERGARVPHAKGGSAPQVVRHKG